MMLASRVRETLGRELSLAEIFTAPVLGDQAQLLEHPASSARIPVAQRTPTQLDGVDGDVYILPASFAEQRLWFLEELDARGGTYDVRELTASPAPSMPMPSKAR